MVFDGPFQRLCHRRAAARVGQQGWVKTSLGPCARRHIEDLLVDASPRLVPRVLIGKLPGIISRVELSADSRVKLRLHLLHCECQLVHVGALRMPGLRDLVEHERHLIPKFAEHLVVHHLVHLGGEGADEVKVQFDYNGFACR